MEIKLAVREISREHFNKYSLEQPAVYFKNGCWFDAFDNVCAFPLYITLENPKSPFSYYEVIRDE